MVALPQTLRPGRDPDCSPAIKTQTEGPHHEPCRIDNPTRSAGGV